MTKLGMDSDAVRNLANQLDGQVHALDDVTTRIESLATRIHAHWHGAASDRFLNEWHGQFRSQLRSARDSIAGLATSARHNVTEQESASSVGATAAPGTGLHQSHLYDSGHLRQSTERILSGPGPTSVVGLIGMLNHSSPGEDKSRANDYPGGISVTMIGDPPNRHVIVVDSGTRTWWPGGSDPSDIDTDLANNAGGYTDKQQVILEAMRSAGVTNTDHIMLVGHSQGGGDMIQFAAAHAGKDMHIDSVLTLGAQQVPEQVPAGVEVLQIRGTSDLVPGIPLIRDVWSAATGHDVQPVGSNAVVVQESAINPIVAHEPSTYTAELNARAEDPRIAAFESSQAAYFTGAESTTTVYQNSRTTSVLSTASDGMRIMSAPTATFGLHL